MKNILYLFFAVLLVSFNTSCSKTKEKVDELTEFDMSYSTDFTIPSSSVTVNVPVDFTTPDIPTNSSATFSSKKTISTKVTEIKLSKFDLVATTGNFDYLKSITLFMQAPGQPEIQIATKAVVPTGVSTLSMDLSGNNIKEYIFGNSFKLRINLTTDLSIASPQQMNLNETMHVKAVLIN